MKRILLATLMLGLAGTASAQVLHLNGSDTLFDFTTELLKPANCNVPAAKMVYDGGGSGLGEDNMAATPALQQIAPMSRWFKAPPKSIAAVSTGCKVALDGIAIFADASETGATANTCNTGVYDATLPITVGSGDGTCPNCTGGSYVFSDWRDVLRIVYGGQTEPKSTSACADGPVGGSLITTKDCNSDVRATLVANWQKLFQEGTGCNGTDPDACATLRHAFRRDDASGTTDLFVETIGLTKIATTGTQVRPFCNGAEMEDEDPIRRDCSEVVATGDEQVCNAVAKSILGPSNVATFGSSSEVGWHGGPTSNPANNTSADLGLVLPVVIPQSAPYQDTTACSTGPFGGSFRYAPMPTGAVTAAQQKCPDGTAPLGGQCAWAARKVGTSYFFGCVNKRLNIPSAIATISNMDGRVYNMIARNPDGTMQTVERIISGTSRQIPVHHAIYRIHETAVMPGGTPDPTFATGCRFTDATDQIGCLVHASPCSIGYAGLGGDDTLNKALALRTPRAGTCADDGLDNNGVGGIDEPGEPCGAVLPTPTTVRYLSDAFGANCGAGHETTSHYDIRYPLSRNLYFNSRKGFEGADGIPGNFDNIDDTKGEQQLIKCACDRFYADAVAKTTGFIPLTDCSIDGIDNNGVGGVDEPNEPCCATPNLGGSCNTPVRTADP